jgi:hypothetical protein
MTLDRDTFSQKMPWIVAIVIFVLGMAFQMGYATATFATRTELRTEIESARKERMGMIEKVMDDHKAQNITDMDRLYKKLDAIDAKLDRSLIVRR